jgi:S-adenosylmethionine:tRNA ribosyltransferase-isomerase
MKTADFDFPLPEYLIASRPLKERTKSRLLVLCRDGSIEHRTFADLPYYLKRGDMLIMNNTRVFPARLTGFRKNGSSIDVLLVKRIDDTSWEVMSKGRFTGDLKISDELWMTLVKGKYAHFTCSGNFIDMLWKYGNMPIPPYLKRMPDSADKETYQTVFARKEGSIAAPTAGLHFSASLLEMIKAKGVLTRELTLHVGAGTFKPVRTENPGHHIMDAEHFYIRKKILCEIESTRASGGRIISVGTTTTRAIEGYLTGKCEVSSLNGRVRGSTDIFIYPGYPFRAVDSLVTNFHLPRSTPLMLVSALCGFEKLMKAYREAVTLGYRFLSYGDAMLIL